MGERIERVPVGSRIAWVPPVAVGMPCRLSVHGFPLAGRIVEVLDAEAGEVLALVDDGQDATATQGETYTLFTPGEPVSASWRVGLQEVQRADGRWEGPVLVTEWSTVEKTSVLGWQVSKEVRCDPDSPYRKVRGAAAGHYRPRVDGETIERRRWTTTLSTDALAVLRELSERHGISRNEVVERLLASPYAAARSAPARPTEAGPANVTISTKLPADLAARLDAHAAAAGLTRSRALLAMLEDCLPGGQP